ncbi:hypothetical protein [Plantactinospora sp. CA-290183]|uniref:hypothetical protein n=1 Tax=Plantactinospora sp. CA-290183 TaxID=3240006 RepID=UPI003D8B4A0B
MTEPEPHHIPQAVFGGGEFWQRLDRLADTSGHQGHSRWLVGESDHTNRYRLWCDQCEASVVDLLVDREPAT